MGRRNLTSCWQALIQWVFCADYHSTFVMTAELSKRLLQLWNYPGGWFEAPWRAASNMALSMRPPQLQYQFQIALSARSTSALPSQVCNAASIILFFGNDGYIVGIAAMCSQILVAKNPF